MYQVYAAIDGVKTLEEFEFLTHAIEHVRDFDVAAAEVYYIAVIDPAGSTVCEVSNE